MNQRSQRTPLHVPTDEEKRAALEAAKALAGSLWDDELELDISADLSLDDVASHASHQRQFVTDKMIVDPMGHEPLAPSLAQHLLKRPEAHHGNHKALGNLFHKILAKDSGQLEKIFSRILKLKKNAEQAQRNAFAYYAYSSYIEETDREPTKKELKKFITARREKFKDAPDEFDKKGWTRLWRATGLFDLKDKTR